MLNEQQVLRAEREEDKKKIDDLQTKIDLLNKGTQNLYFWFETNFVYLSSIYQAQNIVETS